MDEGDDPAVADAFGQDLHHLRVVDLVEEFLEVHIDCPDVPFFGIGRHGHDRVLRALAGAKAIASIGERKVVISVQNLSDSLLYKSISDCWDAQLSEFTRFLLGNADTKNGRRPVCAFDDRTGEFMRVCADVVPEFVRTHPVHARGTTIGLNSRKSLAQIRVLEYFLKCDSVRHVSLWGLSVSESFRLPPIRRIFSVPRLLLGRIVTSG